LAPLTFRVEGAATDRRRNSLGPANIKVRSVLRGSQSAGPLALPGDCHDRGEMDNRGPIAIVTAGEIFGGAECHVLGLGAFLRDQGYQPHVVLFHDRELAARCRDQDLPHSVLVTRNSFDASGPRRLGQLLAQQGTALVHVHGYRAAVNVALAGSSYPLVCTLHGQGEPSWRDPGNYVRDRLYRRAEAWACLRRRAVICCVTDDLQRRLASQYRGLTLRTVRNGIAPLDRSCLPPPQYPLAAGRLHAVAVGRLTRVKGLEIAIEAMAGLKAGHPWHLDLVGEGELRGELEALASRLGVADRVTFHGFRRDVEALMAGADLLLMPSRHEGLPYTLLEAMSLGLPVLATAVGGLAEVLRDEDTSLLIPAGDVRALSAALGRLGEDADLRARLGQAAAREQRLRYTLTSMGEGYLAAYELAMRGAGTA
jgi:glycosyltransferase involved in cell wall biosynthesis